MKTLLLLVTTLAIATARAAMPVIDSAVLAQAAAQVKLAGEQLAALQTELKRLGDPAIIHPKVTSALLQSLGAKGVAQTGFELRTSATGHAGVEYDGDGLYRPPGETFTMSDGTQVQRRLKEYKKFDAITRGRAALENVMHDTEERRQQLRGQIKSTVSQLQSAKTAAEVEKLQGLLTAQNSELAAIDRERDAALGRVLVQKAENDTDSIRQDFARREERMADFRAASDKLGTLLTPDTKPVLIPDPRNSLP